MQPAPPNVIRILIADDEQNLRLLIQTTLEASGTELLLAATGRHALEAARQYSPHLILLDWMMPELSGIEVLRELRQDPKTRDIPVIMLTAKGQDQDRKLALETGADRFLVKPFSPLELLQVVQQVMNGRGANDEHRTSKRV